MECFFKFDLYLIYYAGNVHVPADCFYGATGFFSTILIFFRSKNKIGLSYVHFDKGLS